jgi:hypothetical protein
MGPVFQPDDKKDFTLAGAENKSARSREWHKRGWTTRKRGLEEWNVRKLQLGVGVRADFAVQIDFFVLRGYPFHGRGSLENLLTTAQG